MHKLLLYFHTVRYLKWIQIKYRIYYLLEKKLRINRKILVFKDVAERLIFSNKVILPQTWMRGRKFKFINLEKDFGDKIDWDYAAFGKLWTYNLNYFEWLMQEDISVEDGLKSIHEFINHYDEIKDGREPFPISLRLLNWIKFISENDIQDSRIDQVIHQDAWRLYHHPEYHLLGNHLLENGFGLFFAGSYLNDDKLLDLAEKILRAELEEQILPDGGHFELSPMYHQHMLFRVLDCIQLLQKNEHYSRQLLPLLTDKAEKMLGWLASMTFDDGTIPLFNDSANNIAPTSGQLFTYAKELGLHVRKTELKESGYRRLKNDRLDCIIDVGNIGPDYIPGHAHADSLSFELQVDGRPFIVDTGTSTYEVNEVRQQERSTSAHNTVVIDDCNQSEVWGGFRVAKRVQVEVLCDEKNHIEAVAKGYSDKRVSHKRSFTLESNSLIIEDEVKGSHAPIDNRCFFHFYPGVKSGYTSDISIITEGETFKKVMNFNYAPEFNKHIVSDCLEVKFDKKLKVSISL